MYFPVSSKNSMLSNSGGKTVLKSATVRVPAGAGAGGVGAGAETPADFKLFEMSVKSCEISFKIVRSWSIRCASSSTVGFFSLMQSPAYTILWYRASIFVLSLTHLSQKIQKNPSRFQC